MLKPYALFCLMAIALLSSGCIRFVSTPNGEVIDPQKARAFSDGFMDDLVHDRRDALYSKMEKEFHDISSRDQFDGLMDNLYDQFGKVTKYEYVRDEVGVKFLYNGQTKPTRKMVYEVTTSKGIYPLGVTVVPNGSGLAVTDFLFTIAAE
jgi:hypothetical protein